MRQIPFTATLPNSQLVIVAIIEIFAWSQKLDPLRQPGSQTAHRSHPLHRRNCRRLQVPIRDYLTAILPGLADLPVSRVAELTPTAWAARS
jgi:hypothetical protein